MYLVEILFNITWFTRSTRALACGFLIFDKTGLIPKYFSKVLKSCSNSYMLSNTTLRRCGYLIIHVMLNSWLSLADDLSIYSSLPPLTSLRSYVGTQAISNQPVVGFIIVMQLRLNLLIMIGPPVWCCLIDLLYGPISSTFTVSHGFSSAMFLDDRRR